MKRMRRDPFRFEGLRLLSEHALNAKLAIRDPATIESVIEALRASMAESTKSDTLVHGLRAEAMFEVVVASLGDVIVLKHEDGGEFYSSGDEELRVPDFRVVLADKTQRLIEVKNFYQESASDAHRHRHEYLASLLEYANLMGCELLIATYWVKPNLWTLVPASEFERRDEECVLPLTRAIKANKMSILGDKLIGTRGPIQVRTVAEGFAPLATGTEKVTEAFVASAGARVRSVAIYSEDRAIVDPLELRIVSFLLIHGDWGHQDVGIEVIGDDLGINIRIGPDPEHDTQQKQGFTAIGFLSSMISRLYRQATTSESGGVSGVRMDFSPGYVGALIPPDYKGQALPIWQMTISPP